MFFSIENHLRTNLKAIQIVHLKKILFLVLVFERIGNLKLTSFRERSISVKNLNFRAQNSIFQNNTFLNLCRWNFEFLPFVKFPKIQQKKLFLAKISKTCFLVDSRSKLAFSVKKVIFRYIGTFWTFLSKLYFDTFC